MITLQAWLRGNADLPRLDGELLLGHVTGLSRAQIITHAQQALERSQLAQLQIYADQLRNNTPLAYILGCREFWGLEFVVSPDVLIPRPETELLVELVLRHAPCGGGVLDLGTGSGAIAVAVAAERPDLKVTAVDSSSAALAIAQRNASQHSVTLTLAQSNWFANLSGCWDIIVANPPYIAPDDPHLPALHAEPIQALVAAEDGLGDLKHIINASPPFLRAGGRLILEHGYNQAAAVRVQMTGMGFTGVESAKDLAHIERATIGQRAEEPQTRMQSDG